MNKAETASYLVSLHTLLEAQSKGVHSIPSAVLAAEYNRSWDQLKDLVRKEQEDEARNGNKQSLRNEERTDSARSLSGGGVTVRNPRGDFQGS